MLGRINPHESRVHVIGAGISGLLMAHRLDELGYTVTLQEKQAQAGGLLQTLSTPEGLAESGAHSLWVTPAVVQLVETLQLRMQTALSQRKWICRQNRLSRFPLGLSEILKACWRRWRASPLVIKNHTSLEEWTLHYWGSPVLEALVGPFVRGIYASSARHLAFSAVFPKKNRGSSQPSFWKKKIQAPQEGMGGLVTALQDRLKKQLGNRFQLETPVEALSPLGQSILTVPAQEASRFFETEDPLLCRLLNKVSYTPLVSVTCFAKKGAFPRGLPQGLGFLNALSQKSPVLGMLFTSKTFPGRTSSPDLLSWTTLLGGTEEPHWITAPEALIQEVIQKECHKLFSFQGAVERMVVFRWPRAIPMYDASLLALWQYAQEGQGWFAQPGHVLFGNYTGGVSIRHLIETSLALQDRAV